MTYKRWLFVAVFLFLAGFAWGFTATAGASGPLAEDADALKKLADAILPLSRLSVFVFILGKNVLAVLVGFVLSPFFCLAPAAALVINGGILGLVSAAVVNEKSLAFLLAGTLPHGVFELPAIIIAQASAFSFGTAVMLALVSKEKRKLLLPNLKQNAGYLAIAIVLLVPAAFIEAYLTPLLVKR